MKLELDMMTIFTIKDALDCYRKTDEHDKESREIAYRSFLDSWFESMKAKEKERYKEATSKLNEIIKSHTTSGNYYLDYVNQYDADGLDFFEIITNKYVCTISKKQLEDGNTTVPKTGYRPYKIKNGIKEYIDTNT